MDVTLLCKPKNEVIYVNEETTMRTALSLMDDHHFRCLPILDKAGNMFRGNIYRSHIHEQMVKGESIDRSVTYLLRNATKHVSLDVSFYRLFFAIKDLPYISVLDGDGHFYGIITHRSFEDYTHRAWRLNDSSYVLTVTVFHQKAGVLSRVTKVISRYTNINNVSMLNHVDDPTYSDLIFSLDESCDYQSLQRILRHLKWRGFDQVKVEEAQSIFLN